MIKKATTLAPFVVFTATAQHDPTCGFFNNLTMADMADGDNKFLTLDKDNNLFLSQNDPKWTAMSIVETSTCTALIDFSQSDKPDVPPVPLLLEIDQTSLGEIKLIFTDPSGTLNPSPTYPLNVWTSVPPMSMLDDCPTFNAESTFHDFHDGDDKLVSYDPENGSFKLGQTDVDVPWSLTTNMDPEGCTAMVDFKSSGKADFPPVPLLATLFVSSGNSQIEHIMVQFTDPSGTIADPDYPLNVWQLV